MSIDVDCILFVLDLHVQYRGDVSYCVFGYQVIVAPCVTSVDYV